MFEIEKPGAFELWVSTGLDAACTAPCLGGGGGGVVEGRLRGGLGVGGGGLGQRGDVRLLDHVLLSLGVAVQVEFGKQTLKTRFSLYRVQGLINQALS
jgi:hypothetical protein